MKTIINSLLVAFSVSVLSVSTSLAETNPGRSAAVSSFKSSFYTNTEGKLNVALDKDLGGTVVVRLTSSKGEVLFMESVGKRKQTSRLRLDVSSLPDGAYQVAITNGVDTTIHSLTIATQQPRTPDRLIAVK